MGHHKCRAQEIGYASRREAVAQTGAESFSVPDFRPEAERFGIAALAAGDAVRRLEKNP
jgi:hypothetical protein